MDKLIIAKFGGSAIGVNGSNIPIIINRLKSFKKEYVKLIVVFSAPLTITKQKIQSLTDVILDISTRSQNYEISSIDKLDVYNKITKFI